MVSQVQTFPVLEVRGANVGFAFVPNPLLPGAGLGVVEMPMNQGQFVQKLRLNLTNVVISMVGTSTAFGGTLLGYLPNRNYVFIGGETNLTVVKDGTGVATGDTPKMAVGTVVASAATLALTMLNMINGGGGGVALGSGLSVPFQIHSNDNVTAIPFLGIVDSATSGIFINAGGAISVTLGTLTVSGVIDLYYINLGKVV